MAIYFLLFMPTDVSTRKSMCTTCVWEPGEGGTPFGCRVVNSCEPMLSARATSSSPLISNFKLTSFNRNRLKIKIKEKKIFGLLPQNVKVRGFACCALHGILKAQRLCLAHGSPYLMNERMRDEFQPKPHAHSCVR